MTRPSLDELEAAILDAGGRLGLGVVVEPEGEPVWANPEARALLREATSLERRLDPGEAERLAAWRAERLTGLGPATHRVSTIDGRRLQIASQRVELDGTPARVDLLFDVGERERIEAELSRVEARFQRLLEVAPVAIAVEREGIVAFANDALARLLGHASVQALLGRPLLPEPSATSDGLPPGEPLRVTLAREGAPPLLVEVVGMPTVWDGASARLLMLRDLEARQRVEAHLAEADRLAAVGQLAAGVAHEINNPLSYLLLNVQYLMRELPRFDGDPGRLTAMQERLQEARHGAERVSAIVRELQELSSAEVEEGVGSVDLGRVLRASRNVASPELEGRAELQERWEVRPPVRVQGGARRLEQVFVNLLVNAAHSIPPGHPSRHRVELVVARLQQGAVVVEVRDTGVGIPRDLQRRVFDPFFTTKPAGVGTGLGLPISHGIVTSLGGQIQLESEPGVGTCVSVHLPLAREAPVHSAPIARPTPVPGRRPRVLVVDDELAVATMLSRLLSEECDVELCTSAAAALRALTSEGPWDLVLCDLMMPGMTGMDLHTALEEQPGGLQHRLVFMTGGAFTQRAAEFLARVENPRIEKPFDVGALLALVRRQVSEGVPS